MAKSIEHLTNFVFVNMANLTLIRRDSSLPYFKARIKPDMLAALNTAPLQLATLFPDSVIKQAKEDIASYDEERSSTSSSMYKKGRNHPYKRPEKKSDNRKQDRTTWKKISSHGQSRKGKRRSQYSSRPAKDQQSENDNYCVSVLQTGLLAGSQRTVNFVQSPETLSVKTIQTRRTFRVNCSVVNHVLFAQGFRKRKM